MPECQNSDGILFRTVAIKSHVSGITELDDQFTQIGTFSERPADFRGCFQLCEAALNRLTGPLGSLLIFLREKTAATVEADCRAARDDQSWQVGGSASASVPHLFSQSRTSAPVR